MGVRNFAATDHQQVVELWNTVFSNPTGRNDPSQSIGRKVRTDDGLFFVALEVNMVIGTVMAGYDGHRGWLYSVAVHPNFQRQGVGTKLVQHAERALQVLGCPKINLQILADNQSVTAFYTSLGYACEARISMGKVLTDESGPRSGCQKLKLISV